MKIIDFEKKGNVIRFYLGKDNCTDYWGDDWNDAPYEYNAETVYNEFIEGYLDVAFNFEYCVFEPCDDWQYDRLYFSKEDMKENRIPCIIVVPEELIECSNDRYIEWIGSNSEKIVKFYFNDKLDKIYKSADASCILTMKYSEK